MDVDMDMATDTDTQPWARKKQLGTWRQRFAFGADIKMLKISICCKGSKYKAVIWAKNAAEQQSAT